MDEWPQPFVRPRSEARLSKEMVFVANRGAPVRGMAAQSTEPYLWLVALEYGSA